MAIFSNGSEGICFDEQCEKCIYGQKPCPIAGIQMSYNYDVVGNKTATQILNDLVKQDGTCMMYKTFKDDFKIPEYVTKQKQLF